MLDDSVEFQEELELDAPSRRRVLEQLGVTIHSESSEIADEYYHAVTIDLMSEEMTQELGAPTDVRMMLGSGKLHSLDKNRISTWFADTYSTL